MTDRRHVAVIGSGVAGLTAAHILGASSDVSLLEAGDRFGGHVHTHQVDDPKGPLAIDSGFIVHNDRTYPCFRRLLRELEVTASATEMSMSISDSVSGIEYAGGRGLGGILADRRAAFSPRFVRVLAEIRRFHRVAARVLAEGDDGRLTFGSFLERHRFSAGFVRLYAVPLVACVWSTGSESALGYPALYLFHFLENHGMLSVGDSPSWLTIDGGSRTYADRIVAAVADARTGARVTGLAADGDGVSVTLAGGGVERFDAAVVAVHSDDALALLADPSPLQRELLGAIGYGTNQAVLHTDGRWLPRRRGARASWNYRVGAGDDTAPVVTYWMNRLQRLDAERDYLVTLGAGDQIEPGAVVARMTYRHPVYDVGGVEARRRLGELNGRRLAFAGAYHGWGFHEDGCAAGIRAAAALGADW